MFTLGIVQRLDFDNVNKYEKKESSILKIWDADRIHIYKKKSEKYNFLISKQKITQIDWHDVKIKQSMDEASLLYNVAIKMILK